MKTRFKSLVALLLLLFSMSLCSNAFADWGPQLKTMVVLVQFTEPEGAYPDSNYDGTIDDPDYYYNNIIFGTSNNVITGEKDTTLRNYYREVSNQKLDIVPSDETCGTQNDGVVRVTLDFPHPNETVEDTNLIGVLTDTARNKVYNAAMAKLSEFVNIAAFDQDNDNLVATDELNVILILAGGGGEAPHFRAFNKFMRYNFGNTNLSGRVSFVDTIANMRTIFHEVAHSMGAEDLYTNPITNAGSVSLMDSSSLHLDPWNKIKMADGLFVEPTVVTSPGIYTVNSIDNDNPNKFNILKVPMGSSGEYLLIENCQFSGFDKSMQWDFLSGGIGIWKSTEFELPSFQSADDNEYDAVYEGDTYSKQNKFYYMGEHGSTMLGSNTLPGNSKTFEGRYTGVTVKILSQSSDCMNVQIDYLDKPLNVKAETDGRDTLITWNSVLGATEYEIEVDGNVISGIQGTSYIIPYQNGKHSYTVRARNENGTGLDNKAVYTVNILYGDVNFDGAVTENDVDIVKSYVSGISTFNDRQRVAADVDGNGLINSTDLLHITRLINGVVTQLPVGFMKVITYGDADGDGFVTTADKAMVESGLDDGQNRITEFAKRVAADVSGSGIVDEIDSLCIRDYLEQDVYKFWVMDKANT